MAQRSRDGLRTPIRCRRSQPNRRSRLLLRCVRPNVAPQRVKLLGIQHALPWRHLILAVQDGALETRAVGCFEAAKIEALPGADEIVAVAGGAIFVISLLAGGDFRLILRAGDLTRQDGT